MVEFNRNEFEILSCEGSSCDDEENDDDENESESETLCIKTLEDLN